MIIEIPKKFTYETRYGFSYVDNRGILILKQNISFSKVMYRITYTLKQNLTCPYCGTSLTKANITIDHMYPQDRGGPTIPENLVPCCLDCNTEKSNMTKQEYEYYRTLKPALRDSYHKEVERYIKNLKYNFGYEIPEEWLTTMNIKKENIIVKINFREDWFKSAKYAKIKKMYRTYRNLTYPVIIDRNNVLLDGFYTLMYAEKNGITRFPIIQLENVEKTL